MDSQGVALVAGGSRGIGRAIAVQLAQDGYDVAICYSRDVQAATEVTSQIEAYGRKAYSQSCNVSDYDAVQGLIKAVEEALGSLSVLVNSAGIVRDNPLVLMDPANWHAVLDTNLTGTFNTCRAAVFGFMKRKQGCIVNISSVAGVYGNATQSNYAASKAGIIGFSKSLARELAPFDVRVNAVAPGFIETDMTSVLDDKVKQRAHNAIPLRRFGSPQDVANIVSFVVSDKAGYITGQTLQVDGGIAL